MAATIELLIKELNEINALIDEKQAVEADFIRKHQLLEIINRANDDLSNVKKVIKG